MNREERLEHLRDLAEAHLGDYDLGEAVDCLCDIENCTRADLPDEVLVETALRCLGQIDSKDFPGHGVILRQVLSGPETPIGRATVIVSCQECGRKLPADSSELRLELTIDDELIVYCASCWQREFGDEPAPDA